MSDVPGWMKTVAVPTLKKGKRVLAVEGDDDKGVYTAWLKTLAQPGTFFSDKVVVVDAGDKHKVLQGLIWFRDPATRPPGTLYGLVDRDAWDAGTIATQTTTIPQLLVNANRHCLESYFSDPLEIAAALRAKHATQYTSDIQRIDTHLKAQLPDWVDRWSLWVTTCQVSQQMTEEAFPGFFHDRLPLPDDGMIEARLETWARVVDPNRVLAAFRQERSAARLKTASEQFRGCVQAKMFYRGIVVGQALQPIKSDNPKRWMLRLAKWMADVPIDLAPMLRPLLR
jgi:hypothetical protein